MIEEIRERHKTFDTSGITPRTVEGEEMMKRAGKESFQQLAQPHLTDLEVAYNIAVVNRNSFDLIGLQLTAKDRIRWLSAKLAEAHADREVLLKALDDREPT